MRFTQTSLPGVLVVEMEKHEDARGYFARTWCAHEFARHGLPNFVQTNMSQCRRKGTVRGFHYQLAPFGEAKYLRCTSGAVFDVVLDIRPTSPTFMQWFGIELTAENRKAIFVPEGMAHAHQALADNAEVIYSCSCVYHPDSERGVRWNDPAFNVNWPITDAIVSEKDSHWPDFKPLSR